MRVKLKTNMFWPPGSITRAGESVDLPEETAADWIKRGLAEPVAPAPRSDPESSKTYPKGKR